MQHSGTFAAFPSHFSAAKLFYDLRLDLRIEHLPIFRGYGSGRRGQDNERDAATRYLRGRCAAEAAPPLAAHPSVAGKVCAVVAAATIRNLAIPY